MPLGWAKEAPILTQSRIDVPRDGARLDPGTVTIAGVAWAPDRGVAAVEVQIDEGGLDAGDDQQRPSRTRPGSSSSAAGRRPQATIASRFEPPMATGVVQTDERTRPEPDGARGHHTIEVSVG